jgi:hypothetical protein
MPTELSRLLSLSTVLLFIAVSQHSDQFDVLYGCPATDQQWTSICFCAIKTGYGHLAKRLQRKGFVSAHEKIVALSEIQATLQG